MYATPTRKGTSLRQNDGKEIIIQPPVQHIQYHSHFSRLLHYITKKVSLHFPHINYRASMIQQSRTSTPPMPSEQAIHTNKTERHLTHQMYY